MAGMLATDFQRLQLSMSSMCLINSIARAVNGKPFISITNRLKTRPLWLDLPQFQHRTKRRLCSERLRTLRPASYYFEEVLMTASRIHIEKIIERQARLNLYVPASPLRESLSDLSCAPGSKPAGRSANVGGHALASSTTERAKLSLSLLSGAERSRPTLVRECIAN
ncbi:hypothetical protein [Caballeronia sordidicola]|uniref:hypothetical protein n=1 Tax=Caballeronia sordidicola TaxID=196367 RepID=UPI001180EB8B|nr:hypothetical protein [Caballeronia sordidicola]